jgi:hypothetical protein
VRGFAEQQRYADFVASIGSIEEAGWTQRLRLNDGALLGDESADDAALNEGGRSTGWREARVRVPPPSRMLPAPTGPRVGPTNGGQTAIVSGELGGFFDTYPSVPSPHLGEAYYPGLPSPLNYVERMGGGYRLGDGSLVSTGTELERIYAEQKARLEGRDEPEPILNARSENRLRDGQIPPATQLMRGVRELDPTCHPFGAWELDPIYPSYSARTQRYENQVTRAPGVDYVVRNPGGRPVKFDGCAVWDPRRELLEAKGPGYAGLFDRGSRWGFATRVVEKLGAQAARQVGAAHGKPIGWHVAEPAAVETFRAAIGLHPIGVVSDPAR